MKKCWAAFLFALVAEVAAIWWRWGAFPTDSLRVWYEGSFQTYFVDSFTPWLVIFTALTLAWLLFGKLRSKASK